MPGFLALMTPSTRSKLGEIAVGRGSQACVCVAVTPLREADYLQAEREPMRRAELSRREFLATGIAAGALIPTQNILQNDLLHFSQDAQEQQAAFGSSSVLRVDYRQLVSHADLDYSTPTRRSEAGQPIGNGSTGTLVWTTPAAVRFQVNRVDVYAQNRDTHSFPERNLDYGSGCGFVDINFGDYGQDVFSGTAFNQHLSVYDGVVAVKGNGVNVRAFVCADRDVLTVEVEDNRPNPSPINIDLRMLRYINHYVEGKNYILTEEHSNEIITRNQSATSTLGIHNGDTSLTQCFREGNYYNASAVVIRVVGRTSKATFANDSTVRLGIAPARGKFHVLIASASSFLAGEIVREKATADLNGSASKGFESLVLTHKEWWHSFWSKAFVRVESSDRGAIIIQENYTYFLYVMAASSRGAYIPKYGGMLWFTNGDMRQWGAQHWWHNTSCDYNALPVANRPELMQPMISTYSRAYQSWALAARQQWGSKGIFIPETIWFDGLEELPDDIAAEMQDLYLTRKPWDERSERFRNYAEPKIPHNSRWNWKGRGKWINGNFVWQPWEAGPYGPVTHILSSGAKIAHLYWQMYEHTQDESYLLHDAYPILKGVAEFYCNFPNLRIGQDGKYHIHNVNNHEPVWGARDTQEEISAIRGVLPVAIKAAEILQTDAAIRLKWGHVLSNLAPIPTNASPDSPRVRNPGDPEVWISGLPPAFHGELGELRLVPAVFYDLCCVETEEESIRRVATATFEALYPLGTNATTTVAELDWTSMAAANLGRSEDVRHLLLGQILNVPAEKDFCDWIGSGPPAVLPNRMTLREGPGAIGVQRLGRMAQALHASMLQSNPARSGGDPLLHVFPAWPKDWDAQYTLSARGGFVVTSSWRHGLVEFVEIKSLAGRECQLRNPWRTKAVTVFRDGVSSEQLSGSLLKFPTHREETLIVVPVGSTPDQVMRSV